MFKKIMAVLLVAVMCFSLFAVTVSAAGISTFDISSAAKQSTLSFSGTTATCKSSYQGTATVKSVKIVQSLQKESIFWTWSTVGGEWTKTSTNVANVSFTNTKTGLASGTYRVKSVFTVTLNDGTSETVTVYSSEVEI